MELQVDAAADLAETLPKYFVDLSPQPDDILLDAELQTVLAQAIRTLSPTLRIVFIRRDLEGLSTAETAEVLDISSSAVKVRLHRARQQLRQALSAYLADQGEPSP